MTEQGNDEETRQTGSNPLDKKSQGEDGIKEHHDPELWRIMANGTPEIAVTLGHVSAVPRYEGFDEITVADDEAHEDDHFSDTLEGLEGDKVFKSEDPANRNDKHEHHGQPREDGTCHKIRGKNRAVISGNDGDGEIPGDDTVHGDYQGSCKPLQAGDRTSRNVATVCEIPSIPVENP